MNNSKFILEGTDEIVNLSENGHDNDQTEHQEMKEAVEKKFKKKSRTLKINNFKVQALSKLNNQQKGRNGYISSLLRLIKYPAIARG